MLKKEQTTGSQPIGSEPTYTKQPPASRLTELFATLAIPLQRLLQNETPPPTSLETIPPLYWQSFILGIILGFLQRKMYYKDYMDAHYVLLLVTFLLSIGSIIVGYDYSTHVSSQFGRQLIIQGILLGMGYSAGFVLHTEALED